MRSDFFFALKTNCRFFKCLEDAEIFLTPFLRLLGLGEDQQGFPLAVWIENIQILMAAR